MLGWFLLFIGTGWLVYKYRRTDINPNEEESSSTLSPFAVFTIIVAILVVLVIIMAAVLYAWVQPLPAYHKSSPYGTLIVYEGDDGVWDVQSTTESVKVSDGVGVLTVTSDVPILSAHLVEGWVSMFYMQKDSAPVLEVEIGRAGKFTTEYRWTK